MNEPFIAITVLLVGVYVASLLIFYRLGEIRDLLKEIRDSLKKEV